MHTKPVRPRPQYLPLNILLVATSLALSTCCVTYGQERHDVSKNYQVEVPFLNVLNPPQAKNNAEAKQPPIPAVPFNSKSDIEIPTEALLKTRKFTLDLGPDLTPADILASLFVDENVKQPAKASPAHSPAGGAFSKRAVETPSKLLLEFPDVQSQQPSNALTANALPSQRSDRAAGSVPTRENPTVQPGRIHWHADLATATAQSKQSGKPVFHFQLLGQLDQRFT